jgi:integrase
MPHREQKFDDDDLEGGEGEVKALTREQLATVLAAIPDRHRLLFEFLASTGMRISEVAGLQWRHVDLDGDHPHIKVRRQLYRGRIGPPKSSKGKRDVPLSPSLVRALDALREHLDPAETDPVFQSKGGRHLSVDTVRRYVLRPIVRRLGLPWATYHTFRHTAASLMFEREPNVVAVSRFLGHASPQITLNTYLHLIRDKPAAAIDLGTELALEAKRAERDNKWAMQGGQPEEDRGPAPSLELAQ